MGASASESGSERGSAASLRGADGAIGREDLPLPRREWMFLNVCGRRG